MTQDLPARMLRLLSLLQTRREWTGAELAERLGVTLRTIRRDIYRLRDLGYPVQGTTGKDGGYRLAAGTDLPPLLLDDEEAVAITVALRTATVSVPWAGGPQADPSALATLAAACRDHEIVTFTYASKSDTAVGRRRVEPHGLVVAGDRWYLVAYDTDRADWRTFRVDRLTDPAPTGRRVPPRPLPAADAAAFLAARIAAAPARYTLTATVPLDAETLRARPGTLPDRVRSVDEHTSTLDLTADDPRHLAAQLFRLDPGSTVHGPAELAPHLEELGQLLLRTARALAQPLDGVDKHGTDGTTDR
ncbi:WYL domain-containing protein [Streptomyces roseoverticillatus]|uniref:helix-turn-helix transcriptional regulator n=1 Tax=Streptomyces roseoverticillatus TaxID=66429 RepID=UPI0033E30F90